jgi:hypothetical protein
MNNKNSMSKATYRYLRIMEVYRHNLHICWCTRCENEIIWVDFYPLHEGLCKSCRKEKAREKAPQEGLPAEEESG